MSTVIFDLDGTLALIKHRIHLVKGVNKPDWHAFFKSCVNDTINKPVADMFYLLRNAGHTIWIFSGRSDVVEDETLKWLGIHKLMPWRLLMRTAGDYQSDVTLKKSWLKEHFPTEESRSELLCVFDDRDRLVKMWRDEGITCFQVAPGDF